MESSTSRPPVIIRLPNWVGDVCMALPALHLLLETGSPLQCLGRGWAHDLLAGLPVKVHTIPHGFQRAVQAWRACEAETAILLTNSLSSAIQARMAGIATIGYRGMGRGYLLSHTLRKPATRVHEVEHLFRLALGHCHQYGLPTSRNSAGPLLNLPLTATHVAQATSTLQGAGIDGPFLVIAPLAVGKIKGRSKAWPGFPELCRRLHAEGHLLVVCPGPGEEMDAQLAAPGAMVLSGLSLGAYAAVCARSSLVVSNDSGPSHLAAAVSAPVLAIFGLGQPWRTAPWGGAWVGSDRGWPTVTEVHMACLEHLTRRDKPEGSSPPIPPLRLAM